MGPAEILKAGVIEMKYDVFDVPLGLLREWSTCDMDRYADNGRLMFVGVCVNDFLHGLMCHDDGEALRGRYVVVDSYACFGDDRFGRVCSCGHGYFDLLADALAYVEWMYDADRESLHDCTHMGHDYEVWHVVGDAPFGDLAPELPAMALEVLRQLRDAGELGDPDELTDDDFLPTTYRGDLPLATVTRSDSDETDIDALMWDAGYFEHPVCDDVPKHGRWYPPRLTDDELDFSFLDDYWDTLPDSEPVNTWQEIDIQPFVSEVL